MQRFIKIFVAIILTFLSAQLCAQADWKNLDSSLVKVLTIQSSYEKKVDNKTSHFFTSTFSKSAELSLPKAVQIIRPDFYTADFGFFCKQELQLEKRSFIALRLRLGSLDYCNFLENK